MSIMNPTSNSNWRSLASAFLPLTVLAIAALPVQSADRVAVAPAKEPVVAQVSTFTIPSSPAEGRDPFYPKTTRFNVAKPLPEAPAVGPVVLELKGISGTAERPLALINNRTFAVGEEQEVNSTTGRVKIVCLAIDADAMKVQVRAQGETRELLFRKGI